MFGTIVVPLDHSDEAEVAIPHGAALARQAGARLQLLTVRPGYADAATIRDRLGEIADRYRVDADIVVAGPGDIAMALAEVAREPATVLCLSTHARRPMTEMVMGSVSEQVVRTSCRPVLLIGPNCDPAPARYAAMVVGLDGSPLAERILPTVAAWSTQLDLQPSLLQVLSPHMPFELGDRDGDIVETGYVHNLAAQMAADGLGIGWETAHDRDPAAAIVRYTDDHQPALIALTTHGHSGIGRLALGGVAFRVARCAHSPVVVLRPSATNVDLGR